jgi:hypothetical protein
MMRATDVWTAEDRDETRTEETVSMETASAIVTARTTRTITGVAGTLRIGEIRTSIRNTGLTDGDTKTRSIFDPRVAV